jgi:multidrug resistance efflux pump
MTPSAFIRRLIWPVVLTVVAAALSSTSLFLGCSATPSSTPTGRSSARDNEGVVCFGTVDLEEGVTSLSPLQPGRVAKVLVHENQDVKQGTELLSLEDGAAKSRLAEAEEAVNLAQLQVRQAKKLPDQHRSRVAQQEATLEAARRRLAAARLVLTRKQKMARSKFIDESESAVAEEQVNELEALERAEVQRLDDLKSQDLGADRERAEAELKAAVARRDQARQALEECHLKAPVAGTVLRIHVGPGDVLGAQQAQPAVLFAADGRQVVRASVEQDFVRRIKEGQPAVIQDEADASVTWRGQVERLAGWYSQRRAVLHDPAQLSDVRTLECVIVMDPGHPRLRLGQTVRVYLGVEPP